MTYINAAAEIKPVTRHMRVVPYILPARPELDRPELEGLELHFGLPKGKRPSEAVCEFLNQRGWKFMKRRNGQWEPRWYKVQSYTTWCEAQEFCAQFSTEFGSQVYIQDSNIPEKYRHPETEATVSICSDQNSVASVASTPAPPAPDVSPQEEPMPMPEPDKPQFSNKGVALVYDVALCNLLESDSNATSDRGICMAILEKPPEESDSLAWARLKDALFELCDEGHLIEVGQTEEGDTLYGLPDAEPVALGQPEADVEPEDVEPEAEAEPEAPPEPEPDPEEPMTTTPEATTPDTAQGGFDLFGFLDGLTAYTNQVVQEVEAACSEEAQRKQWIEAIQARIADLRAKTTYKGRFRFFQDRLDAAVLLMQLGLALAGLHAGIGQEGDSAKKNKAAGGNATPQSPKPSIQQTPDSVADSGTSVPQAETSPSLPETKAKKPKTQVNKKAKSLHQVVPRLDGEAFILQDDELSETAGFVGCYAYLESEDLLGLSFKSLLDPIELRIDGKPYVAQPGTFQPLSFPDFAAVRLKAMINIRRLYTELIAAEGTPGLPDEFVEECRANINEAYDEFVAEHGTFHHNKKFTTFQGLTDYYLLPLLSLEVENKNTLELEKADLFFRRQVRPPHALQGQRCFQDDPSDRCSAALDIYMDMTGNQDEPDIAVIAQLAGLEPADAEAYLMDLGRLMRDPIVGGSGHRGKM